jgi:hypothetical protein
MLQRTPPNYSTNIDQTDANDISGTNEIMHYNLAYAGYAVTADYNLTGSPLVTSNSWSEAGVTVSSADFQSLAFNQMTNARLANGALPVITFMHLTSTGAVALTNLGCFIVPPVPTGLTATTANTQASLSWNPSTGAYGYNVYRSTANGGPYTNIALWVTNNSYTDTNLSNGTTYYYVVTAVNPGDESSNSTQIVVVNKTTPVLETAPTASPITYGQTLSASILSGGVVTNSSGTVVFGSFAFTTNSLVLGAGTASQSVTFTPTDTTDYNMVSLNVSVTVNPLAVTLTGIRAYDGTTNAVAAILSVADALVGDNVTVASGTGGLSAATVGTNSITSAGNLVLGGLAAGNYTLTGASGSVIITQAESSVILASSGNPSAYSASVTFSATVTGADIPTGTVEFLTNNALFDTETLSNGMAASISTATLPVGTNTISGIYSGDGNYLGGTNNLSQVVKAPQFSGISVGGNGLVMSGSWGTPDGTYDVLVTTNVFLPLNQWTPLLTNQFDINGNFNFTNIPDPGVPQQFYILQAQ